MASGHIAAQEPALIGDHCVVNGDPLAGKANITNTLLKAAPAERKL